jgi:hypothetical protein
MRRSITLHYVGGANAVLLYGPETAYGTQKSGVKNLVTSIVNNSGSGVEHVFEIWVDNMLVKHYHAKFRGQQLTGNWNTANPTIKDPVGFNLAKIEYGPSQPTGNTQDSGHFVE